MKKTLTRAGAIGLAAATILTGLSFGPAAASAAAPDPSSTATRLAASSTISMTLAGGKAGAVGTQAPNAYGNSSKVYDTVALAEADARAVGATYTYDPINKVITMDKFPGLCLYGGFSTLYQLRCNANDAGQKWEFPRDGSMQVAGTDKKLTQETPDADGRLYLNSTGTPAKVRFAAARELFYADVVSVDLAARTAQISGTAVPGSTVIINDDQPADVDGDGNWSATVSGLTLGMNTTILEQYEDGTKTDDARVEIDLAVDPVDATVTFDPDVTKKAVLSGSAHPGATVVVEDATGTEIDRAPASPIDGTWSLEVTAPNLGGAYPVTIHQLIDHERNGDISQSIAYGAAVEVTRPVPDAAHDGGPLAMRGTGEPRAQLLVREQGHATVIGSGDVLVNGTWNLATSDLDARKHVLEVTQTGKGGNVTTSTITINPEAETFKPLTVETPESGSTVTTSRPVFTGHGQDGASVTIGYGATAIGTTTVVDGDWTITPTRGLGMGVSDLTVTQDAGGEVSTLTHTLTRVAAELPLAVTSHVDGQTYAEGMTTFRGTAPVGSTIRATNQWGTPMGTATATDGTWSFNRILGPTAAGYDLTFTATPPVGDPQTVSLKLNYAGALGFEVTSPVNDSTYTVGTTTFTGTAMPGTVVTATNQWSTPMGRATAGLAGTWAFDRYLGPTSAGYDIAFVAAKGTDTQRTALHLATAVVNVPVDVTSITDGATYRPGLNVLTGTGTPGATVEAVNATNGWNVPMGRATVKPDGTWALPERNWGPSNDYAVQVTQTNPDKTTSTTTVNVKAPVFAPLVLTSPAVGDTYDTGVAARFEGTATPFATVSIRSAKSDTTYRTVEADADGHWSFTRVWGPTHDYVLNIDQKARNGQSDSITGFAWNHSGN
ncbi:hypothetical protein EDF18_2933 [Frigoribacterium sp. PhB107]|uniref:hypothetical protein n=1 Tax=Frigoribacterium sp. PhB107 TaxID=2485172 RepID=UPI000FAA3B61|nr:hypothetical protein [Frigoribacterium sp. PhB107]ROP73569.1 hypothetical protein EDF18_2933 [Frigoribacterium sp. PhB107]